MGQAIEFRGPIFHQGYGGPYNGFLFHSLPLTKPCGPTFTGPSKNQIIVFS